MRTLFALVLFVLLACPALGQMNQPTPDYLATKKQPYRLALVQPTQKPIQIRPGEVLNISVQVTESKSGRPVSKHKVTCTLYYKDNPDNVITLGSAKTNAKGVAAFKHRFGRYDDNRRAFMVFSSNGADSIKVPIDIVPW